ncbi:MAG TPA: substrate-binding domain-containing protein [Candidatus Hydrogenedentes bacterium]|nr:substrate-binding domain-containing protein [Candidatus Hydrogenedentota bacterium]
MKKLVIPLILLAAVMAATYVVRNMRRTAGTADPVSSGRSNAYADQFYVEVSALGNLDYFYDHKLGLKMAGEFLGVQTDYIGPAEYDMTAMVTAFEQVLAKPNLKGVLVVGFEDVLIPTIDKAVERGIPVVTLDADLPNSKRVAFVGTGNFQAGYQGGQKLAELIGRQGKVALMTKSGQSNLEERVRGYREALADFDGVEIVQVVDTKSDSGIAAQVASAVLDRHPDLTGLACVEAAGGVGAAAAVRERGLVGQVKIVAMDRGNDILGLIGEGVIDATVAQQTALMPFYGAQILFNLQNATAPITKDNEKAGVLGVPPVIDTGVIIVDNTNYEFFIRE